MNKTIIFLVFGLFFMMSNVSAFDYYTAYIPSFTDEAVNEFYVTGAQCSNSECSAVTNNDITLLDGEAYLTCVNNYNDNFDYDQLVSCLSDAELESNLVTLTDTNLIVTKESGAPSTFGSLTYFFPNRDTYIPYIFETVSYPQECIDNAETEVCFDSGNYFLNFGKIEEAIAEVGQVNIKNVDNPLLPIQVEVPVQIEETVCSAYRFANLDYWTPSQIPSGYSDFDALTQIDLDIQFTSNGTSILEEQVIIPIEAETCAGLAAFSWTPSAELENEQITFTITTEVIDTQVITSLIDTASVTETVYPEVLDGVCWTRAYDFTLANEPTLELDTSLAQIQEGEFLFAGFSAGAWRDDSVTPMQFEALVVFDDGVNIPTVVETTQDTSGLDLQDYFVDLSSNILGLPTGEYEVTLITRPQGPNCIMEEDVIQTQRLTILEVPDYELDVFVSGNNSGILENATVIIELLESRDEFQVEPEYQETQTTNEVGYTQFVGLIAGEYLYEVSKEGYTTIQDTLIVGSDAQLYINLPQENSAPLIDLPEEINIYYQETLELDLELYIVDFNDLYENLDVTPTIISGNAQTNLGNGNILEIITSTPNVVELQVSVEDPSGYTAQDTMTINFVDNLNPFIDVFEATPTNGAEPFTTTFLVRIEDDDTGLSCTIDYDDGTTEEFTCEDGVDYQFTHTFTEIGQYNTVLRVEDEYNFEEAIEQVFVFERTYASPEINYFLLESSNGEELPTDVTLSWDATHSDDLDLTCILRINGVDNAVDCSEEEMLLEGYNIPGTGVFTLTVYDTENHQVTRNLERTFFFPEDEGPRVNEFSVQVIGGSLSPVDTIFTVEVEDDVDLVEDLTCRVDFGDGIFVENSCDEFEINPISHTYINTGAIDVRFVPTLTVIDTVGNIIRETAGPVLVEPNRGPAINDFRFETSNGAILPTNLTFYFDATHDQGLDISCSLFINGNLSDTSCSGTFDFNNYTREGLGSFTFLAADELGVNVSSTLDMNFERINAVPTIDVYTANRTSGVGPYNTTFDIELSDADGDTLSYTLDFANGNQISGNYTNPITIEQEYVSTGVYSALLIVSDGIDTTQRDIVLTVLDPTSEDNLPNIDLFSLSTSNGFLLPNDLTFNFAASHPQDLVITCQIETPTSIITGLSCASGSYVINNYNSSGLANFTFTVTDSNGLNVSQSIVETFFALGEEPDLTLDMVSLKIDKDIAPGEFSFTLLTRNETLAQRELFIQPEIKCDGFEHKLTAQSTFLPTRALSNLDQGDLFEFPLKTNTNQFSGDIPEGETCLFETRIIDAFGTDITVVNTVEFNYEVQESMTPSINGFGTDVMDFLDGTIGQTFTTGYNGVDFRLVNHESIAKELSISLSSTQLGINFNEEVNLGPDSSRDVTIPLLFTRDQKGLYPVRLAVFDGDNKQVKYSYIYIE